MKGDKAVEPGADKLETVASKAAGKIRPVAPSGPQIDRSKPSSKRGPNPFVVAGAAFGLGTLLAKAIDWRGHAHPRR
ncbi:MAG: hypothetical protein M3R12_03430 [Actinomycetota bacterium]|nr:hypothetical protein [Actinomycetota bacterium]